MRRYETIIITDPDLSAEQRDPVLQRVTDVVKQGDGYLALTDEWGSRKLAYEIKKKDRGYYIRFDYCGTGAVVKEMERFFRIDDRVLKYMTVLVDKTADIDQIKEEIAAAQSKAESAATPAPPEEPAEVQPETTAAQTPSEAPAEAQPETTAAQTPSEAPAEARPETTAAQTPSEEPVEAQTEPAEIPLPEPAETEEAQTPEPEAGESETAPTETAEEKK
jgi:small subunit ribosomal protein S6